MRLVVKWGELESFWETEGFKIRLWEYLQTQSSSDKKVGFPEPIELSLFSNTLNLFDQEISIQQDESKPLFLS